MECTGNLLSSVTALQTLLSNFPDNILVAGYDRKEYDSIFDFMVDLFEPFGITPFDVLTLILSKVTGISEAIVKNINNTKDLSSIADDYYESGWLMTVEDAIKYVIATALASIPSCSANLMIGDSFLDPHLVLDGDNNISSKNMEIIYCVVPKDAEIPANPTPLKSDGEFDLFSKKINFQMDGWLPKGGEAKWVKEYPKDADQNENTIWSARRLKVKKSKDEHLTEDERKEHWGAFENPEKSVEPGTIGSMLAEGGIILPIRTIDPFNYLKYCPLSRRGKGYYSDCDGISLVSDLYRSKDMNAFLWYCENRSFLSPQHEVNKTMWDNRLTFERKGVSRSETDWSNWISSKKYKYYSEKNAETQLALVSPEGGNEILKELKPILQVTFVNRLEPSLLLQIPSQEYYRSRKLFSVGKKKYGRGAVKMAFNKTLIEYNIDYLKSIRIFSAKAIMTSMIETFYSGAYLDDLQLDIDSVIPKEKIKAVIRKMLKTDTSTINDCFFSFSNEEYNSMLEEFEMIRFSGKNMNSADGKFTKIDKNKVQDAIDKIIDPDEKDVATLHEEKTVIENNLYDLSLVETEDEIGGIKTTVADNWLESMLETLILSMVLPLFSPKVLIIFLMNYRILGYDEDFSAEAIIKKLMSVLMSCIWAIIESIIQFLLEYLINLMTKGIASYIMLRSLEMITNYIRLLQVTISLCLPKFNFPKFDYYGSLDYVDHADIIPEKTTPDSKTGC